MSQLYSRDRHWSAPQDYNLDLRPSNESGEHVPNQPGMSELQSRDLVQTSLTAQKFEIYDAEVKAGDESTEINFWWR